MYGLLTEAKDETARIAFDRELDRPFPKVAVARNGRPNLPPVDVGAMLRLQQWMKLEAVDG